MAETLDIPGNTLFILETGNDVKSFVHALRLNYVYVYVFVIEFCFDVN